MEHLYPEVIMPVQKVKLSSSRVGYRWGKKGKVYTGKDGRKKAQAQGKAVEARLKKAKG
jgi:hypothetical protein